MQQALESEEALSGETINLQKVIPIIPLKQWILKHVNEVENLGIKLLIVDDLSPHDVVLTKKSNKYSKVYSLQDTHKMNIPDMPPKNIILYRGNQYSIVFQTKDLFEDLDPSLTYYIRAYYHRSTTSLYSAIKLEKESNLLPFLKTVVKERSTLDLIAPNLHHIGNKLAQEPNTDEMDKYIEKLQLLKSDRDGMFTYSHLIEWLFDKYRGAYDINTHITIDNILLEITQN